MKRYPGYSLDGVMIVLLSVMGFASHATHAEDENEQPVGIVKGTASLVHVDESGERTVIKGRPLNDVVVFLEPNGHTPPFTPQTNHAEIRQKRARFAPPSRSSQKVA